MKTSFVRRSALAIVLSALLLLSACGRQPTAVPSPASDPGPGPAPVDDGAVRVTGMEELLAALVAGEKSIILAPGVYDVSDPGALPDGAGDIIVNEHIRWGEVYDGYELILDGLDGVSLKGEGDVQFSAVPRYANVLSVRNSRDFSISGITLGHTAEPGLCSGGVIYIRDSSNLSITDCELYGCGTVGVSADNSTEIFVTDCDIYDCTTSAADVFCCSDVRLTDCDIYRCGSGYSGVFSVFSSVGFAAVNCDIENNRTAYLLNDYNSRATSILGCDCEGNSFSKAVFLIQGNSPTVDGCSFSKNAFNAWYDSMNSLTPGLWAVSPDGSSLGRNELEQMTQHDCTYSGPDLPAPSAELKKSVNSDGMTEVHVSSVDEFLVALAPDTVIYLDDSVLDLSAATDYGASSSNTYRWRPCYDGTELVIHDVDNLTIVGSGKSTFSALSRYANVLCFENCSNLHLSGFTAGHTEEPGDCSGGVLYLSGCSGVEVNSCRLYGCGIIGISTDSTVGLTVTDTEIFDCSYCALSICSSDGVVFDRCDIHDCGEPEIYTECSFTFDGKVYTPGRYSMENGLPVLCGGVCIYMGSLALTTGTDQPFVIGFPSLNEPVTLTVRDSVTGRPIDCTTGWWYCDNADLHTEINPDGTLTFFPSYGPSGISASIYFSSPMSGTSVTVNIT